MKILRYLLLLPFLLATFNLHAQWNSRGPYGGMVYDFYRFGGQVWAATSGGVFFSGNDGLFWNNPASAPAAFGCGDVVRTVGVNGQDVFAGTAGNGVFRSNNGGTNWVSAPATLVLGVPYTDIEAFSNVAFIVRGDSGILYSSPDHGLSWLRTINIPGNSRVRNLSQNNNVLYLTTNTGLYSSPNGGNNFFSVNADQDLGRMEWVGDTLYVATPTGIRRSVDLGATFTPLAGSTGRALSLVAAGRQYVYSAISGGSAAPDSLFYSSDGGASFNTSPIPAATRIYAIMAGNAAGTVLVGTDYGILRSTNGGITWSRADSGLRATTIRSLAVSGANLYAGAYPMGIFLSADSAVSWQHRGSRTTGVEGDIRAVAARNNFVHGGGVSGYYRSTNFGNSWTPGAAGLPVSGAVTSILVIPGTSKVLLADSGNLYASANDGSSFTALSGTGLPANIVSAIIAADTSYFAIAGGMLYHSGSDMVFTAASGISGVTSAVVFADSLYYAGTLGNGLYVSRNGTTWTAMMYPPPYTAILRVQSLATDSGEIFAGTDNGILRITPAGLSGMPVITSEGLQGHGISSLAVMSHHLYAGTCNGVWTTPYQRQEPEPSGIGGNSLAAGSMQVYPNPAQTAFTIKLTATSAGKARLIIRNMLGETLQQQDIQLHAGENRIAADATGIPAGMYVVQVAAAGEAIQTCRLVVGR